ncbi:unnamed protein product [Prorocentrum cordatum]|uniref:Uncharacterized protein n=1 Tax=Prorocentrum cordatum TaxID=2364126 RepID=A0ABN9X9Y3_9DINO|nr:unnamed protein product [Polarella glacialis]
MSPLVADGACRAWGVSRADDASRAGDVGHARDVIWVDVSGFACASAACFAFSGGDAPRQPEGPQGRGVPREQREEPQPMVAEAGVLAHSPGAAAGSAGDPTASDQALFQRRLAEAAGQPLTADNLQLILASQLAPIKQDIAAIKQHGVSQESLNEQIAPLQAAVDDLTGRAAQRIVDVLAAAVPSLIFSACDVGSAFLKAFTSEQGAARLIRKFPGLVDFDLAVDALKMAMPGFGLKGAPRLWNARPTAVLQMLQPMPPFTDSPMFCKRLRPPTRSEPNIRSISESDVDELHVKFSTERCLGHSVDKRSLKGYHPTLDGFLLCGELVRIFQQLALQVDGNFSWRSSGGTVRCVLISLRRIGSFLSPGRGPTPRSRVLFEALSRRLCERHKDAAPPPRSALRRTVEAVLHGPVRDRVLQLGLPAFGGEELALLLGALARAPPGAAGVEAMASALLEQIHTRLGDLTARQLCSVARSLGYLRPEAPDVLAEVLGAAQAAAEAAHRARQPAAPGEGEEGIDEVAPRHVAMLLGGIAAQPPEALPDAPARLRSLLPLAAAAASARTTAQTAAQLLGALPRCPDGAERAAAVEACAARLAVCARDLPARSLVSLAGALAALSPREGGAAPGAGAAALLAALPVLLDIKRYDLPPGVLWRAARALEHAGAPPGALALEPRDQPDAAAASAAVGPRQRAAGGSPAAGRGRVYLARPSEVRADFRLGVEWASTHTDAHAHAHASAGCPRGLAGLDRPPGLKSPEATDDEGPPRLLSADALRPGLLLVLPAEESEGSGARARGALLRPTRGQAPHEAPAAPLPKSAGAVKRPAPAWDAGQEPAAEPGWDSWGGAHSSGGGSDGAPRRAAKKNKVDGPDEKPAWTLAPDGQLRYSEITPRTIEAWELQYDHSEEDYRHFDEGCDREAEGERGGQSCTDESRGGERAKTRREEEETKRLELRATMGVRKAIMKMKTANESNCEESCSRS